MNKKYAETIINNTTLQIKMEPKEEESVFRVAIIGRSSSGKSTLVKELSNRGYSTLEQLAREVLEERKEFKATPEENLIRQKEIYFRQLERENLLQGLSFCDRGLVDILAYAEYFGVEIPFADRNLLRGRYHLILELEKRPFVIDGLRIEKDEKEADKIYEKIRGKYLELEYTPVPIPNFCEGREKNVKRRVDYIEEILDRFRI